MKIKELIDAATEEKAIGPYGLRSVLNRIKIEEYTAFSQQQFEELELGSLSEFCLNLISRFLNRSDLSGVPKAKQPDLIKAIEAALVLRKRDTSIVKALFKGDFTELDKTFPEAHEKRQFLCETRYMKYMNNGEDTISTARLIQNPKWCTILHYICMLHNNNAEVIKGLLDRGADPNAKATEDDTPLHFLMRDDFNKKIQRTIVILAVTTKDGGETKLSRSEIFQHMQEEFHQTVQLFLNAGADITAANKHGFTPFHEAAFIWHYPVVEHFGQIFKARRFAIDSLPQDLPAPIRGLIVDYYYVSVSYQKNNPVLFDMINAGELLLKVLSHRYTSHPQWEERRKKTAEMLLKHTENACVVNDQGKDALVLAKELSAQNCQEGIDEAFVAAVRDKGGKYLESKSAERDRVTLQVLTRRAVITTQETNAQNANTPTLLGDSLVVQSQSITPEQPQLSNK